MRNAKQADLKALRDCETAAEKPYLITADERHASPRSRF